MFAFLAFRRKLFTRLTAVFAAAFLAGCDMQIGGGPLINTSRAVPVALLVPSSSPNGAELAISLENAARLAVSDLQTVDIDLRIYDTGGTAEGASLAAADAIDEGAKIFIGALFGEAAAGAGQVAAQRGVNVLTFSNNPAVAGGNVFLLGNTFQNSADRLVNYAVRQGKGSIYIVHAQDAAEELGRDSIQRALLANGGSLAGVSSFPLSQQGVINEIPNIASGVRDTGAATVFVTSGTTGALPFLADLLPENGIDAETAQFIGLQRLDIPSSALSLKGLQGAWFATPSPDMSNRFNARYQAAFGTLPSPVAGLAYDGIAAVGALVAQGNADALGSTALTQGQGFAGVYGPFRFFPNGTNQRGLAVAQIQNNQVVVIDPSPTSFGGAGF
ncbi:MAG: penicillin-binding protein activator [Boseongicola sp.]|nr:penicillin-binding protein activator [Boseongicola sp.]